MGFIARLMSLFRRWPHLALAVELTCLIPALMLLAVGGYGWGGYLFLQHQVQAAADQALAAARGVRDPRERERLARSAAVRLLPERPPKASSEIDLAIESRGGRLAVTVTYDAARSPIFVVRRLIALPSPTIMRLARER
jgi:Flp pilus assembly protein TadG